MIIWCEAWYINFSTILSFEFFIYNNFKFWIVHNVFIQNKIIGWDVYTFYSTKHFYVLYLLNTRLWFFFLFWSNQIHKLTQQKHPFEINLQIGPFKKKMSNIDSVWYVNHSWIETWHFKAYLLFLIFKYKY